MKVHYEEGFGGIRLTAETLEEEAIVQKIIQDGQDGSRLARKEEDGILMLRTFNTARGLGSPASVELIPVVAN